MTQEKLVVGRNKAVSHQVIVITAYAAKPYHYPTEPIRNPV